MMTLKFLAGSAVRLIVSSGLPSTSKRSASAPFSTTPSLPGYGLRLPDVASSSALVPVAMASASAGLYQRTSEARMAPCFCASAWENRTSVPHAVLILYFFASSYVAAMPARLHQPWLVEMSLPESLVSTPRGGAADLTTRPSRQSAWRLSRPSGSHVRCTSRRRQWLAESPLA